MNKYLTKLSELNHDSYGEPLVCSGCANSAADAPFPGHPSGERPYFFCNRNVKREEWCADHTCQVPTADCKHPAHGLWYHGKNAVKSPMDCYKSVDMLEQIEAWLSERN